MIYCFDLDGTLCNQEIDYNNSKPWTHRIKKVNELYDEGHTIKIFTGRGVTTKIDWKEVTEKQLKTWGLKYHELIMYIKPHCDVIIDNIAINSEIFFKDTKKE